MACLTIHSQLNDFKLVAGIAQVFELHLTGEAVFDCMPVYSGLEAMAQLAALHVRHGLEFRRHAFLLKVGHSVWPAQERLDGYFQLRAERYGSSSNAFAYQATARGPEGLHLQADLLIGTKAYDHEFQEKILAAHYRRIFEELRMAQGKV